MPHKDDVDVIDRPKHEIDELEHYKGQWANLNFHNNGKTYLGPLSYDTEAQALARHTEVMKQIAANPNKRLRIPTRCGYMYFFVTDCSHTIQIPIKT